MGQLSMQAQLILNELRNNLVTHVVGLPDNASAALFSLLNSNEKPRLLTVTREGEAFAVAAGLWVGGKNPVVLIQNTGLLESGDGVRGTVMRMRIPLVCLVTYRGYSTVANRELSPARESVSPEILSRPDLDSVALLTEPTLKAWGLSYDFLFENEDVSKISQAFSKAKALSQPAVLLIPGELTLG
jgi:sulfopyruvate decarboxylase subunit alpha